jgi:holo-[acyl-carrier protein] synthase
LTVVPELNAELAAFDTRRALGACNLQSFNNSTRSRASGSGQGHNRISMIVGSGIDLVEIHRIKATMDRYGERFLNKVYTAAEQAYCLAKRNAAESLAARFAAKEAAAKALGTGISHGVTWLEIEVVREPGGRPSLLFHGRAAEIARRLHARRAALSITHTKDLAMASVLLDDQGRGQAV